MASVGRGVDLKDKEEVKEYLENLGIEYRFGCYHEKNPKACHLLGDYMEAVKKDFHRALKIYETNCLDFSFAHSCHKTAGYRSVGKASDKDLDTAYDLFVRGCDLGYFPSCLNAGLIDQGLAEQTQRKRDPKRAAHYFKRACEGGEIAEACHRYASYFLKGVDQVIQVRWCLAMRSSFRSALCCSSCRRTWRRPFASPCWAATWAVCPHAPM